MDRTIDFSSRHRKCSHPLVKKLFKIIMDKQTNLCLAADEMSMEKLLKLIEKVGPHICMLKIHSEQLGGKAPHDEHMATLYACKKRYNFLLFEDRKFFDGANTVRASYEALFAKYIDIVTVVPDFNDAIFRAIKEGASNQVDLAEEPRGCLAVCELSFANIIRPNGQQLLEVAERNSDICVGIIAQKLQVSDRNNMIKASPGVNLGARSDGTNQQWRSPDEVLTDGADILIVGRGITSAPEHEWETLAVRYKEFCFGKQN